MRGSRCKRVERYEGDLDSHFAQDEMQSILQALTYSRADKSSGISPQHTVPIEGDVVNGTASLRSAVNFVPTVLHGVPQHIDPGRGGRKEEQCGCELRTYLRRRRYPETDIPRAIISTSAPPIVFSARLPALPKPCRVYTLEGDCPMVTSGESNHG